jgi:hypothetical protein
MEPNKSPDYAAAEKAAAKLMHKDESYLFQELGMRIEDSKIQGGETRKLQFEAPFVDTSQTLGGGFLKDVGRQWYNDAETELMKFLCDKQNPDRDKLTSGRSIPQIAASIATAGLLTVVAAPPAWIIVAATLLAQKITSTGIDALCKVYADRKAKTPAPQPAK